MNLVVGFLGHDGYLGRTFSASGIEEALKMLQELRIEQKDTFSEGDLEEHFSGDCTLKTELGFYFIGSLE